MDTFVVFILEVDTTIGATNMLLIGTEVHKIMTSRAQQATHESTSLIRLSCEHLWEIIKLLEDLLGNSIIIIAVEAF